jgi:hypothetical protein
VYFDDKLRLLSIIWHNVETVGVVKQRTERIQLSARRVWVTEEVRNYCLCLMKPIICLFCPKTDQVSYSMFILCTLDSLKPSKQSQALTFPILIPQVLCSNLDLATDHWDWSFQGTFWDYLKLGHDCFLARPFQFIKHCHANFVTYIVWDIDCKQRWCNEFGSLHHVDWQIVT